MGIINNWNLQFSNDPNLFNDKDLKNFDVVIWNNSTGNTLNKVQMNSFENNNQDRFNRARGDFNQNNRGRGGNSRAQGGQRGGQRFGSNNRQSPPRPEVNNPVLQRLAQYVRDQGVSRENMRDVMNVIMEIGREYKASTEKSSYKPNDENLGKLKDAGLSDETIEAVVEVIKALAVYDR